jgi:hypothetical protein
MAMQLFTHRRLGFCLPALLVTALSLAAVDHWRPRSAAPRHDLPEQWQDCRDVVSHLRGCGLDYRAVSTAQAGDCRRSVYLTKTAKTWAELNATPRFTERLDEWRGTVFCEKMAAPALQEECNRVWGDGCLQLGSFVFFGDAALLAEIEQSLATPPAPSATDVGNERPVS